MSRPRFYRAILSHDPIQSKTNKRAQVFLFAGIITYKLKTTLSRDKVADAATVKLHAATLSQLTNTTFAPLFPFYDPRSQTRFQNDETVPYLMFSELFN